MFHRAADLRRPQRRPTSRFAEGRVDFDDFTISGHKHFAYAPHSSAIDIAILRAAPGLILAFSFMRTSCPASAPPPPPPRLRSVKWLARSRRWPRCADGVSLHHVRREPISADSEVVFFRWDDLQLRPRHNKHDFAIG